MYCTLLCNCLFDVIITCCVSFQSLTFEVPVGKLGHYLVVFVGTLLVTLLATIVIIVAVLQVSLDDVSNKQN